VAIHQCAGGNEHGSSGIKEGQPFVQRAGNGQRTDSFIIFADDKGQGSPDTGEIDNFTVTAVPSAPAITNQPQSISVAPGGSDVHHCGANVRLHSFINGAATV